MSSPSSASSLTERIRAGLVQFREANVQYGTAASSAGTTRATKATSSEAKRSDELDIADRSLAAVRDTESQLAALLKRQVPTLSLGPSPAVSEFSGEDQENLANLTSAAGNALTALQRISLLLHTVRANRISRAKFYLGLSGAATAVLGIVLVTLLLGLRPCAWLDRVLGSKSGCTALISLGEKRAAGASTIAVSPLRDEISFATVGGREIYVVNLEEPDLSPLFLDNSEHIVCLAFSPDGRYLVSGHADRTLSVFSPDGDTSASSLSFIIEEKGPGAVYVAFSPDGGLLAASVGFPDRTPAKGLLKVWHFPSMVSIASFETPGFPRGVDFSPSGVLAIALDNEIRLWDSSSAEWLAPLPVAALTDAIAFSPDDQHMAVGTTDIEIWNWRTAQRTMTLRQPNGTRDLAYSPDGSILASASGSDGIRLWDVFTWTELPRFHAPGTTDTLAWSPHSNRLVSGGFGADVFVWFHITESAP